MKKMWALFFILIFALAPASFANDQPSKKRGTLAGIGYLEYRGFSNIVLFPFDWFHLQKSEYRGWYGVMPTMATHTVGRVFSGIADIGFLPLWYPFTKYDDSVPVGMGWAEFPWQKVAKV